MLVNTLLKQIEADLSSAGREKNRIRLALRHRLLKLELSSTGSDDWEPEYRTWLIDGFCQALALAQRAAVSREDYEQAAEIRSLLTDIQFVEEPSILDQE